LHPTPYLVALPPPSQNHFILSSFLYPSHFIPFSRAENQKHQHDINNDNDDGGGDNVSNRPGPEAVAKEGGEAGVVAAAEGVRPVHEQEGW